MAGRTYPTTLNGRYFMVAGKLWRRGLSRRHHLRRQRGRYRRAPASFYGFNRPGVEADPSLIQNWWRQGMMDAAKAHHDGIKACSETDFTDDLKVIEAPTMVMHGDEDEVVPIGDSAPLTAKLLKRATLNI